MIVRDTNVLSELMRPEPDPSVVDWINAQPRASLYTASVCQAELLYGIEAMPAGKRRDALAALATAFFEEDLADQILPLTAAAAVRYARIVVHRRDAGKPIGAFDALIAATALVAGAAVATRDVEGFADCGVAVINPWDAPDG
jgi:predicted nucleic acid-binding protein